MVQVPRPVQMAILSFLIGGRCLAAPPAPPARAFEAYETALTESLQPVFRRYGELAQPRPDWTVLPVPDTTLDRLRGADALGALPPGWVAMINKLGGKSQSHGESDVDALTTPPEYRKFERDFSGVEPPGTPLRTPEDVWGGPVTPGGVPPSPAFQQLKTAIQRSGRIQVEKTAKEVEAAFRRLCKYHVARALVELRGRLQPSVSTVRPAPGVEESTPWVKLGSASVNQRVERYLAERYFKGRWVAGRSRGRSSTSASAGPSDVARQKDRVREDKGTPGGTGSGNTPLTLPSGTGTGSGSASPEQPVDGTGSGKPEPRN